MLKQDYTQAALELLKENKDVSSVILGLRSQLERKGHMALYGGILKEILRKLLQHAEADKPLVTIARASDVEKEKERIAKLLKLITNEVDYVTAIDETLIGGAVVEYKSKIIDASYKKQLLALYKALIV